MQIWARECVGVCVMMKWTVGVLALAALVSGCANQNPTIGSFNWLSASSVPPPTKRPSALAAAPAPRKAEQKVKRVAAKRPEPTAQQPAPPVLSRPTLVPRPTPVRQKSVALNQPKTDCQAQREALPADADRRSATISVQCFFISRGEYLTTSGAVKPLR